MPADSGPPTPPPLGPGSPDPTGPVEPVEDSADDPIPANPLGSESDDDLDKIKAQIGPARPDPHWGN